MDYYYIQVKTNSTFSPPPETFLGSTIRGTFGHFLRDQVCFYLSSEKKGEEKKEENNEYCKKCPHPELCLYDQYYSKDTDLPKHIRFDTSLKANNFDFGIYLFDDGKLSLRFVLTALKRMLNTPTLTSRNYIFCQSDILLNGKRVNFDDMHMPKLTLESFEQKELVLDTSIIPQSHISIKLLSPCAMGYRKNKLTPEEYEKKKGQINYNITLEDIIYSIRFRQAYYETGKRQVIEEYSSRCSKEDPCLENTNIKKHKEEDPIIGVVGVINIYDIDPVTYGLLKYGEIIGVGKKTVMGAGKIKIEVLNEKIV